VLRLGQTWEVAASEIPHLGSCHWVKYPLGNYLTSLKDEILLLKTFIPVSRILDNEDDFFLFSRNFRNSSASRVKKL